MEDRKDTTMKIANMTSDEIASRLILTVMNYEENKENITDFPYIRKGKFALVAQLCVGEKNDAGQYTACLTVTDSMIKQWGFQKNVLFEIAADNSRSLFPSICEPLEKYLYMDQLKDHALMPDGVAIPNVMVLTNEYHFNGAATMFYDPEKLNEAAAMLSCEKLALMPSSVNQVYCIPQKGNDDLKSYQDLYQKFAEALGNENMLSENLLVYDTKTQTITESAGTTYALDLKETAARRAEHRR